MAAGRTSDRHSLNPVRTIALVARLKKSIVDVENNSAPSRAGEGTGADTNQRSAIGE